MITSEAHNDKETVRQDLSLVHHRFTASLVHSMAIWDHNPHDFSYYRFTASICRTTETRPGRPASYADVASTHSDRHVIFVCNGFLSVTVLSVLDSGHGSYQAVDAGSLLGQLSCAMDARAEALSLSNQSVCNLGSLPPDCLRTILR